MTRTRLARPQSALALGGVLLAVNTLGLFVHNRLNAFLYLLLVCIYLLLVSPYTHKKLDIQAGLRFIFGGKPRSKTFVRWLIIIFAPLLLTLYYGDFGLLLVNFLTNAFLTGSLCYLYQRS